MKKIALLSAVLVLIGSPGFATSNPSPTTQQPHGQWQGFPSQTACQTAVKGSACVQHGSNWFPQHQQTGTTVTPPTTATAVGATAAAPPTTPTAPTAPTPPAPTAAPAAAPAAQSGKGFWPFGGNKGAATTTTTTDNSDDASPTTTTPAAKLPPRDPHQAAKGKVWGSQGDCQSNTGGSCVATDCSTHVGGVCTGTKGVVWSYTPR